MDSVVTLPSVCSRAWYRDFCQEIAQPLLRPLYGGKSALEVVDYLANGAWRDGQQIVRESFSRQPGVTDERAWRRTLHDGFLAGSELPALNPSGRAIPTLELGATALAIARQMGDRPCEIVGVDNAAAMIERARTLIRCVPCLRARRSSRRPGLSARGRPTRSSSSWSSATAMLGRSPR